MGCLTASRVWVMSELLMSPVMSQKDSSMTAGSSFSRVLGVLGVLGAAGAAGAAGAGVVAVRKETADLALVA
jgi:hypothetical protein